MARDRSVDFLPEIFKTDTNKEFLGSTLDQLTQAPKLKQTQGFVGRKFGTGINSGDSYVLEPTGERSNYQLEPTVVFKNDTDEVESAITYPEIIDSLKSKGANVSRHDRLFSSPIYSWNPLIDFDKFVNHSQYYWLPSGTDSVDVSSTDILLTDNFDVTRNNASYSLSGIAGTNPSITLVRGGEYTFAVNQHGNKFHIQSNIGTNGTMHHASNISSRDVAGVTNNGSDGGVITFTVPNVDSQQFYYDLTEISGIDLATFDRFDAINGKLVSQLGGIDGIADLEGKTIVFLDTTYGNSADLGWQYLNLHEDAPFESEPFEETLFIDNQEDRYSVYQIEYISIGGNTIIKLNKIKEISNLEKFDILYGDVYSNKSIYKNSMGFFQEIPLLTAAQDTLYYQDGSDGDKFGIINLVDASSDVAINISDIIGKTNYTSTNGVEFTNGLKVIFRGTVNPTEYHNKEYFVEGVGASIKLIDVNDLVTPEPYTTSKLEPFDFNTFDSTNFDGNLNSPSIPDFITINRACIDLNPWSRSNRWVHRSVIEKTAEYNNSVAILDNNLRANRPIIEFDAGLKLFNFGTQSKTPITVIDFNEVDALSNVNGLGGFSIDGFNITEGSRVIFAKDNNGNVRNKIYEVQYIDLNGDDIKVVNLVETSDSISEVNHVVVCTNGATLQGKVYHYDGTDWVFSQQKTTLNQAPLFDVFDIDGYSLSNTNIYPKTSFGGTKLFSYGVGVGKKDSVLGFPLAYLNIDNLGDIVFNNDLYSDTFTYGTPLASKKVSVGFIRKHTSLSAFGNEIGWTKFVNNSISEQVFDFDYDGNSLIFDIVPKDGLSIPSTKVYIDNKFVDSSKYTITVIDTGMVIKFIDTVDEKTEIKVTVISDIASKVGYYSVPKNLENNAFNENSDTLTLGTIRNHYGKLAQNLLELSGEIHGSNNSRDLGNIESYGDTIIQNSSPLVPMAKFLHSKEFDFFESVNFNANAYEKFKLKVLDYILKNDTYGLSAGVILDQALVAINVGKGQSSPFFKSDMIAGVRAPTITTHTVTSISTDTFNIVNIYDFTKASNVAVLVYLNDSILIKDHEYIISSDSPTIQISSVLTNGDIITVKEYPSTDGTYVPNTPTKMGLYQKFKPSKYTDNTFTTPTMVVQGHDGSIMVAFDDIRDDVLLEFETRIYNNIKTNNTIPVRDVDVIPGKFRTTEYTDAETISILSNSFLNWVGWNRLDYKTQDYLSDNELTWNYSTCSSKLDGTALKGHWRGVYKYYYDTDTPHTTPWEMLGISEKPLWWENEYGVAPYTSGNLVLWGDLSNGTIKEPGNNRVDIRYKRDDLIKVIPVDSEGNLLNPFVSIVQNYSQSDFRKSWVIGDCGPTESAWRRSSSYPFALQRLFALTKPAKYFALSIDVDRYKYNDTMKQYLYDSRYRLDTRLVDVQTNANPKHSYINWVADYHNNNGCSCVDIKDQLGRMDIRLAYRMASFTDKKYLKIFTDNSSPDSSNNGLLLPDQSYELLLHKNQALYELQYSAVIVQKTHDGYSVHGHSTSQQYFEILQSIQDSNDDIIGDISLPTNFTDNVTLVPYGYVFTNKQSVIDFLVSYGAFLESMGMVFKTYENSKILNWGMMAQEFLAWDAHGWGIGSIVNLNPNAISLEFNKNLLVVDNINGKHVQALDQNGMPLTPDDYSITRLDNSFKITTINKTINFLKIDTTSYEHLLILDNTSVFNDLMYLPINGLRQSRIKLVGFTTFDWNGQLDAQGFILNQDNVDEWEPNQFYSIGNIIKFKNAFWSAVSKVDPSDTFEFNSWKKINYNDITKGLSPNISTKAGQISEYYNKKTTNLESDVDLLAMGLTGFRPRSYLDTLDDVSQVNFYTGFISNKGTHVSADSFRNVKFDKKVTDYEIFENWAVREATFGNSGNRSFIDLEMNSDLLQNNPSIIEVVDNSNSLTSTHQMIKISELYNQSEVPTSKNIFSSITTKLTNTNLPIAGHVNANDADIALFEITDFNGGAGVPFIKDLISGSIIWVAKDTLYDWNIYRAELQSNIQSIIPVDGKTEITFYHNHDFVTNDILVIQGNNLIVDGSHKVVDVINSKVIRVPLVIVDMFVNIASDSSITSDTDLYSSDHVLGFSYRLNSIRVPSSDNLQDIYIDQLPIGARVWVDINVNDKHCVYEKYSTNGRVILNSDIYNTDRNSVWVLLREEQDVVDTKLINRVMIYDKNTKIVSQNLDYIDPINGKILGIANENIDFIMPSDPALYNQGTNINGVVWGDNQVGKIWWDVTNIRYLDYNQSDYAYSSRNWGGLFPGSTVNVNQWVKSSVHPSQYTGNGTVVDASSFTTVSRINTAKTIVQSYYFWVNGLDSIFDNKTLSTNSITQYIDNPHTSGIGFVGFLSNSTVGIYNSLKYINDGILHISYNQSYNDGDIFNEYKLIKENNKNDFINDITYRKLQDSFVGGNSLGLSVPDKNLSVAERNGIGYRPRQSMFDNRLSALKVYLTQVNSVLKEHIVTTNKNFELLNKKEIIPGNSNGEWNFKVADLSELYYQDLLIVSVGYKYLVTTDTNNSGGWSIYEVVSGQTLQLIRVQKYDTTRAWKYIDWYEDSDAENSIPIIDVSNASDLSSLEIDDKSYVRVTSNSVGKFEIYQLRNAFWVRVGLEDGTIEFSSNLWDGTSTQDNITIDTDAFTVDSIINSADNGTGGAELRNVIKAINESLFVDDILIERNKSLISIFNYILSEQSSVDWLYKTSFIDVEHNVRDLEQYSTYKKDDQDFLLNYLNESKPYHTKIKDFLLKYSGVDQYNANLADFDVPSYYDSTFNKNISPILDYDGVILKSDHSNFDDSGVGLKENDYNIWKLTPWDNWYDNRALSIKSAIIVNAGNNYTSVPIITVSGDATIPAELVASINTSGQIISVNVVSNGSGYTSTPAITIGSGGGNGAIITPIMQNLLVRNISTTIKYDRYEYITSVVDWVSNSLTSSDDSMTVDATSIKVDSASTVYDIGQLVRYKNDVYRLNDRRALETVFDINNYSIVDSGTLSGVDRTMGYYNPDKNSVGLDLSLLLNGIDYNGVEVKNLDFTNSAGFDVLGFDIGLFDIIEVSEDGSTNYSDGILDSEYIGSFNDLYIGTRPSDINADGGEFIDVHSSHSPEELVPSSIFDTLNLVVNTRPGFDYDGNGHAFEVQYGMFIYTPTTSVFSFNELVAHPIAIKVINASNGMVLTETNNYTINWVDGTISILSGVVSDDSVHVIAYEIGGGNQLYRNTYIGDIIGNEVTIPTEAKSIYDIVVMVNGIELTNGFTSSSDGSITVDSILETSDSESLTVDTVSSSSDNTTTISFADTYTSTDFVSITVFGFENTQHEYTYPTTKIFTPYGADSSLFTVDSDSITTDNVSTNFETGVGSDANEKSVSVLGKNKQNAIVEHNGLRLRPPEGIRYSGNNSNLNFAFPTEGGTSHSLISNSEVVVYIDDIQQTLSTDYNIYILYVDSSAITVDSTEVSSDATEFKQVVFAIAPPTNTKIDVYITTDSAYTINGSVLNIKGSVSAVDTISITTWNDTSQLDILTNVFKGPTMTSETIVDLYDSGGFDVIEFDKLSSESINTNLFDLGRSVTNANRLWVTKNGQLLMNGNDYLISNSTLMIVGDVLSSSDVIAVTSMTDDVVPDALSFRLFKDMNGSSAMYRIKDSVNLVSDLNDTDDIIYVDDSSKLAIPNLPLGIFGILIIDGERITYRERDTTLNTISGLRRGTAGTAISPHYIGDKVDDLNVGNTVNGSVITSTTLGADTNMSVYSYDKVWYANGINAPSNGIALQDQVTVQANFVKK